MRELRAQAHGPADPGPPRGGILEGDPERRPEPREGLGRERDGRRHDPFGRGREVPVVRGGPGPGQGITEPAAQDEQRPFDDESELGLGPANGRFIRACHPAGRQDQLMTPEAIPVLRPPEPGDASRRVCPLQQIPGHAVIAGRGEHRVERSGFGGRKRVDRPRPSPPRQATKPVDGMILRMAVHGVFRPLLSVPDQS
jgi:hypothetical protein